MNGISATSGSNINPFLATIGSMSKVNVSAWKCDRESCGHVWLSKEQPKACAKCKSRNWDASQVAARPIVVADVADTIMPIPKREPNTCLCGHVKFGHFLGKRSCNFCSCVAYKE